MPDDPGEERRGANTALLDALFVLSAGVFLVLLILALAKDNFTLPLFVEKAAASLWSFATSGALAGALGVWLSRKSERSAIFYVAGSLGTAVLLLGLVVLTQKGLEPPPVSAHNFDLHIFRPDADELVVKQEAPKVRGVLPAGRHEFGYFEFIAGRLLPGEKYKALAKPPTRVGRQRTGPVDTGSKICFRRHSHELEPGTPETVAVACAGSGDCSFHADDPGWMEACAPAAPAVDASWFTLVGEARAEPTADGLRWEVPSLATLKRLPEADRPGYTEFVVQADPHPSLAEADSFVYAVSVNGTPVYFEGWPPELLAQPYDPSEPFKLVFPLENLNFSGASAGRETIRLEIRFLSGDRLVREIPLERSYVAIRPAELKQIEAEGGPVFRWSGEYRNPPVENKFEIFAGSHATAEAAERHKRRIDEVGLAFGDQPVVAVIRPPLGENQNYGVVLGLEAPTKQVRFTFDAERGADICRDAMRERRRPDVKPLITADAYRYEMQPRPPDHPKLRECETFQ